MFNTFSWSMIICETVVETRAKNMNFKGRGMNWGEGSGELNSSSSLEIIL